MTHLGFIGQRKDLAVHLILAQRGERQRCDKLRTALGQDAPYGNAPLSEAADQVQALIGSNTARDDQQNTLFSGHGVVPLSIEEFLHSETVFNG